MPRVKSITLTIICGAILGTSIVCSTAFAQGLNAGPTPPPPPGPPPIPHSFPTPTPNPIPFASPSPSPAPGVQRGDVAIPIPVLNMLQYLPGGAHEDIDVATLQIPTIQTNFTQALNQLATATSGAAGFGLAQVTQALGKALIYDQTISVDNNLACATCHEPCAGFTGGSSFFNATTSADPGSVPIINAGAGTTGPNARISSRRPQTYAYAPFSPVLHYNNTQNDFYGGNFWDMRAGGIRLGNPAAEQAEGPPTNPVEMANFDIVTYVYKISKSKEAPFFEAFWGKGSLSSIHFPANIATFAATPGPAPTPDPLLAMMSQADQNLVISAFDHAAQSTAAYEAWPEVSSFSSKFDAALAPPTSAVLTSDELAGWNLFRGKAHCNTCHLDGTENIAKGTITPADAADVAPLFTDFTSANIGTPQNFALPFLYENNPDQFDYVANAAGLMYLDLGVGGFLANVSLAITLGEQSGPGIGTGKNPNPSWAGLAPNFNGKVQTPTCRNVDLRPYPGFVKAYMHNGYLKSLKAVVHFYNTRDTLNGGVHKPAGEPGEGITYWPWPEVNANVDQTIGHLGLTDAEENQIVLFLQTLSDGFFVPAKFNEQP